ncbi:MAG: VOC family protein [Vicinamibacterales bacterium]
MAINRGMPNSTVIPELAYPDVKVAADWLCRAFGFKPRLLIGGHRAQLSIGDGAMVVTQRAGVTAPDAPATHAVMVRVADVDAHHAAAVAAGATVSGPPATFPYGERQYTAVDPGGHRWTFSQSVADIDPASWGGVLID